MSIIAIGDFDAVRSVPVIETLIKFASDGVMVPNQPHN